MNDDGEVEEEKLHQFLEVWGQFLVEKTGTFNMVGAQGWWVRCQNLNLKHQITIGQWLNERFTESGLHFAAHDG